MPDLVRIACTRCQQSVYSCMIEGPDGGLHRIPIAIRLNAGQPGDTGGPLDVNGANIRLPSVIRSLMLTPLPRIELCVKCFADVMGLPLLTAEEDPMYSSAVHALHDRQNERYFHDETIPFAERLHTVHMRALHSFAVGWGDKTPEDLPPEALPDRAAAATP